MSLLTEHIYDGRDNTMDLILTEDNSAVDLSAVTRMVLTIGGVTFDSDVLGAGGSAVFDWTVGAGQVNFKLGTTANLPAAGNYQASLVVYSPDNTNGIEWGNFSVVII